MTDGLQASICCLEWFGRLFSEITEIYIIKSFDETNYFAFAIVLFGLYDLTKKLWLEIQV